MAFAFDLANFAFCLPTSAKTLTESPSSSRMTRDMKGGCLSSARNGDPAAGVTSATYFHVPDLLPASPYFFRGNGRRR